MHPARLIQFRDTLENWEVISRETVLKAVIPAPEIVCLTTTILSLFGFSCSILYSWITKAASKLVQAIPTARLRIEITVNVLLRNQLRNISLNDMFPMIFLFWAKTNQSLSA